MSQLKIDPTQRALTEKVRAACVQAAIAGFEQARMDGLCEEGAVGASCKAVGMKAGRRLKTTVCPMTQ